MSRLVIGVLTFFGVIIGIAVNRHMANRSIYSQLVSKSRNKWLSQLRQSVSCVLTEKKNDIATSNSFINKKFYNNYNKIMLNLNLNETLHLMLSEELKRLPDSTEDNFDEIQNNIILISQHIFKIEWNRVKKEAKGRN
jgi:hypothetical protein